MIVVQQIWQLDQGADDNMHHHHRRGESKEDCFQQLTHSTTDVIDLLILSSDRCVASSIAKLAYRRR